MAGNVKQDFSSILYNVSGSNTSKPGGSATKMAQAELREQNKSEWTCELTIIGNPQIVAGITFFVEDFGIHSGKWIADKVEHSLGGGYTTRISGRRCLEGY